MEERAIDNDIPFPPNDQAAGVPEARAGMSTKKRPRIGGYKLLSMLSEGGYGIVYLADHC